MIIREGEIINFDIVTWKRRKKEKEYKLVEEVINDLSMHGRQD